MGETCKGCGKWDEEIYWNHFQSNSFIQFLTGNFQQQLAIPKKFYDHLKQNLPDMVELKGPSGRKWDVGLVKNDDTLFFKNGWQGFVKDHSLAENDILIFTYNREKCFRVLTFDAQNSCEKEAAYFVRNCESSTHDCGCPKKRKERESSVEVIHNSNERTGCTPSDKSTNDDSFTLPRGQHAISPLLNRKSERKTRTKSVHSEQSLRRKEPSTPAGAVKVKSATEAERMPGVNSQTEYVSNRRPVTEDEKKNAFQLAQAALTDESFMVTMHPTHVYKGSHVAVPAKWLLKHLSREIQLVTLRFKESTWDVKYYYNDHHALGRFTSGWKKFAIDNNLEESDVCVFKPATSIVNSCVIVDVSIFRVVQEAVPTTRVIPGSGSGSKRGKSAIKG